MTKVLAFISVSIFVFTGCNQTPGIQRIDSPAGSNSHLPRLFTDNRGAVFMSWVEETNDTASLYYAVYKDHTWSEPVLVQSSDSWFVNWADFPSVIARNGKPVASHWLAKIPGGTYSYNVEVTSLASKNSTIRTPHTDQTPTEHGFVSMQPVTDSTFYAIWLDGRNTEGRDHHEYSDLSKAMTLRGALLSSDGLEFLEETELDASVCDCCNTSLARTENGLIAAYRDRTEHEIRDISVRRYEDGAWSESYTFSDEPWQTTSCPVNGPQLSVHNETIAVAWFSGAEDKPKVKVAFSSDEGNTFTAPIIIDSDIPLGRVDIELIDQNEGWISWISGASDGAVINLKRVNTKGEQLDLFTITDIDPSRRSGFPQLTQTEDGLLLAWTNIETKTIELAEVIL